MGVDGMNSADIFDEYFDDEKPKYIIKNCPAFAKGIFCKGGDIIDDGCADKTLDRNTLISCQDCTDCIIKQIVEKCKTIKAINKRNSYVGEYIEFTQKSPLAEEILYLLNIQEVE